MQQRNERPWFGPSFETVRVTATRPQSHWTSSPPASRPRSCVRQRRLRQQARRTLVTELSGRFLGTEDAEAAAPPPPPSDHWKKSQPSLLPLAQTKKRRPLLADSLTTVRSAAGFPHWHSGVSADLTSSSGGSRARGRAAGGAAAPRPRPRAGAAPRPRPRPRAGGGAGASSSSSSARVRESLEGIVSVP